MKSHGDETERRNASALGEWENKGGAPGRYSMDIERDRRIVRIRSSTVYHASASLPAHADHDAISGSRAEAGNEMVAFNLLNIRYRREWIRLSNAAGSALENSPVQPWR
ncbi:hypothetical protein GGI59_001752 [Rhizobium lentis]|uniref:Uncharacterized protein n=1 Tax=Rhizobium lentis TaxID=1138194 RepID=A0A7W8ULC4_9HYPH|nr:hypothetical protein [Rhizobium lentis]MBB5549891.1 hypothetical protein [Rhizobium lentis]MBB5560101.1 hypothetical protein [Rhizobium lentis]MBB5567011.1 hypothetical protein [Rhizobium lentis]